MSPCNECGSKPCVCPGSFMDNKAKAEMLDLIFDIGLLDKHKTIEFLEEYHSDGEV